MILKVGSNKLGTLVRLNDSGNEIRAIIQKEENKNIEVTHTKMEQRLFYLAAS